MRSVDVNGRGLIRNIHATTSALKLQHDLPGQHRHSENRPRRQEVGDALLAKASEHEEHPRQIQHDEGCLRPEELGVGHEVRQEREYSRCRQSGPVIE